MDILDKLKSQIGDDVQYVFDHEALFKAARDEITALRARLEAVEGELGWRTVAESNQAMAQSWQARAERAEAALATFEPREGERWVTPDMIQYQYEWMEWLAGDQPLVPMDDLRAAQSQLATARRDALEEAAKVCDCRDREKDDSMYLVGCIDASQANAKRIRALADEAPE